MLSYYSTVQVLKTNYQQIKLQTLQLWLVLGTNIIYVRINSNTPCYAITIKTDCRC
jgi:hypothetical protein